MKKELKSQSHLLPLSPYMEETQIENQSDDIIATSSFSLFLKDISRYPTLTTEEENALLQRIANGDILAKDQFIKSNLRLVVSIAKKYKSSSLDLSDLVQEGTLGLMRSLDLFDLSKGLKFSTYAVFWIRKAISKCIINTERPIRIPEHMWLLIASYQKYQNDFYKNNNRYPTDKEIIAEMQISNSDLERIRSMNFNYTSLNLPTDSDENDSDELIDILSDSSSITESIFFNSLKAKLLLDLLSDTNLNDREKKVIILCYGSDEKPTQKVMGEALHVSSERIGQIHKSALDKLRKTAKRQHLYSCDF